MKNKLKTFLILLIGLALSLVITYLPNFFAMKKTEIINYNEVPAVAQKTITNVDEKITYNKLYNKGHLVGVITNLDDFYNYIDEYYHEFQDKFPNTTLGLTDDLYIVEEDGYVKLENVDKQIVEYLDSHDLLGVKCKAIDFSTKEGVYDIIYVSDIDLFYKARDQFLLNFISEDALTALNNKQEISEPVDFGSVDTGIKIQEMMTVSEAVVSPNNIYTTLNEIYTYFCYGRTGSDDFSYYTTKEGDTVQAVGYYFGDMSAKQIMMLNPTVLSSADQLLAPGTELNVTYYKSPITVSVTKQRLAQETVLPESPLFIQDPTLNSGTRTIKTPEKNGIANVLYEETWINGVLQAGNAISSTIVEEPVRGEILVGTFVQPDVGTGNWGWPTNNPYLTCNYTCYYGHGGIDIQNRYNKYDSVLAMDSGVVVAKGYTAIGGYYVRIDHNNGYVTYYGHMRSSASVEVGQTVARGDILGPIGMTGVATGPHVHLAIYKEGSLINPCSILACGLIQ